MRRKNPAVAPRNTDVHELWELIGTKRQALSLRGRLLKAGYLGAVIVPSTKGGLFYVHAHRADSTPGLLQA